MLFALLAFVDCRQYEVKYVSFFDALDMSKKDNSAIKVLIVDDVNLNDDQYNGYLI